MNYYIYCITNNINNKTYIGQRKCPENKLPEEDDYMGSGELIKKAIKKYGIENFSKIILESEIETKKEVDEREIYFIAEYKKIGKAEYNISIGGTGGNLGEEVCDLMRKSWKENYDKRIKIMNSDEVKNKVKLNLSKAHKEGKFNGVFTDEVRKKKSESAKKAWKKYGDRLREQRKTPAYRKAVSESKKGILVPNERKLRISESVKKLHNNPEYKKKFLEGCKRTSEKLKGRVCITIHGKHRRLFEKDIPDGAIRGWV